MVGLFKQKTPVNILVLFVAGILIKLPMFIHPVSLGVNEADTFIYRQFLRFLEERTSPGFLAGLAYFLLFIQAMLLNRFFNDYRMIAKSNYLPAMSYLLISSLLPEWNRFSAPLLLNTFTLVMFYALFRMYNQQRIRGLVFNIGLSLGLASFAYAPSLFLIIWVLPGLLVMKPVKINEWIICILGLLTPYYLYASYLFIEGDWGWDKVLPAFSFHLPGLKQSFWLAGATFLLIIPFLAGGYFVQVNLRRMLIQVRKNWSLILIYMLVSMVIPFFTRNADFTSWITIVIPFSAFHACAYYYPEKRWFPLILFWATVAYVLVFQYYEKGWIT